MSDTDVSATTVFRPQLDPYGTWVSDSRYGLVWVPSREVAGADFAPYVSGGHWELDTNDDWVWVTNYPFGDVVFHYGRWVYIGGHGWAWVPGRQYASSWVVWRVPEPGFNYVAWAPMPPHYGWFGGGVVWYASPGYATYVFCPAPYVFHRHVSRHLVRDRHVVRNLALHTQRYRPPPALSSRGRASDTVRHRSDGPPISRLGLKSSQAPERRSAARPRLERPSGRSTAPSTTNQPPPTSRERGRTSSGTRVRPGLSPSPRQGYPSQRAIEPPRNETRTTEPAAPSRSRPQATPRTRSTHVPQSPPTSPRTRKSPPSRTGGR